jgi:hypothetical protein
MPKWWMKKSERFAMKQITSALKNFPAASAGRE